MFAPVVSHVRRHLKRYLLSLPASTASRIDVLFRYVIHSFGLLFFLKNRGTTFATLASSLRFPFRCLLLPLQVAGKHRALSSAHLLSPHVRLDLRLRFSCQSSCSTGRQSESVDHLVVTAVPSQRWMSAQRESLVSLVIYSGHHMPPLFSSAALCSNFYCYAREAAQLRAEKERRMSSLTAIYC